MRPSYNQHSLTCRTMVFESSKHGPSPWTLWRVFLWLCHQSLPVGIMLRAVDGWAPKKRSPFARQTVLPVQLLQNYSFIWFGTDAGNLQDNTCMCLSAWTLQINPGFGSEIACILNLKQTYTCWQVLQCSSEVLMKIHEHVVLWLFDFLLQVNGKTVRTLEDSLWHAGIGSEMGCLKWSW